MPEFVYLASQSPRRRELLEQIGVRHRMLDADVGEDVEALEAVHGAEAPTRYVRRVSALKLEAALARARRRGLNDAPVLCADTTVAVGRIMLGKPVDETDAVRMLRLLSGRTHRVLTSVSVGWRRQRHHALSESRVTFERLDAGTLKAYVASGECLGKAGAYAVQGRAAAFITRIHGSYSGVMGLPLHETAGILRRVGVLR